MYRLPRKYAVSPLPYPTCVTAPYSSWLWLWLWLLLKALPISFCLNLGITQIGYDHTLHGPQNDVHFKPKRLTLSSMRVAVLD